MKGTQGSLQGTKMQELFLWNQAGKDPPNGLGRTVISPWRVDSGTTVRVPRQPLCQERVPFFSCYQARFYASISHQPLTDPDRGIAPRGRDYLSIHPALV